MYYITILFITIALTILCILKFIGNSVTDKIVKNNRLWQPCEIRGTAFEFDSSVNVGNVSETTLRCTNPFFYYYYF